MTNRSSYTDITFMQNKRIVLLKHIRGYKMKKWDNRWGDWILMAQRITKNRISERIKDDTNNSAKIEYLHKTPFWIRVYLPSKIRNKTPGRDVRKRDCQKGQEYCPP